MTPAPRSESTVLPLPLARQLEVTYQRFESAWRAGQRPLIEDHLSSLPASARAALLPELLELELSYRRRAGETVCPDEYRQRFPEHAALIGYIFREQTGEAVAPWWWISAWRCAIPTSAPAPNSPAHRHT